VIDLDQIRSRADLVSIARGYGLHLRKMGFQFGAPCPFHKEKTPSFFIHPEKQFYKCWGCNAEGDVFKFVQHMESLPGFRETAKRVAELVGMPLTDEPWTPAQKQDYARRREYARTIGMEAEQFWLEIRLYLAQCQVEAYQVEHQACRWALKHMNDPGFDEDPRTEVVWLIAECAPAIAEDLEERLRVLDRADPELLVQI
jgi:DNA primase